MGEKSAFATATARPKNDPQATPLRSRQQSQVFAALDSNRGRVGVDPVLEDALDDERPRLVAGDGWPAAGARPAQAAVEGSGTRSREDLFEGRSDQRGKGVGARGRGTHLAPNVPGALLRQGLNVFDEPSRTSVGIVHLRSAVTKLTPQRSSPARQKVSVPRLSARLIKRERRTLVPTPPHS